MAWKPGESGNPGGVVRRVGVARFAALVGKGTPKQIVDRIVKQALKGDSRDPLTAHCLKLFCDRVWPALQRVEQTGAEGGAIAHRHEMQEVSRHLTRDELREIQAAAKDILRRKQPSAETPSGESVH